MTEPSITCISCSRTGYNPEDVANKYCGACHAENRGSIIWTASEQQPTVITGSVGSAPIFQIAPSNRPHYYQLGIAPLISIIYEANDRYDAVPQAYVDVIQAKYAASVLLARLMRLVFFTQPSLGTSGGVPVTDEVVEEDELSVLFATMPMQTAADADALFDKALELKRRAEEE